jgi:hypothetical protein
MNCTIWCCAYILGINSDILAEEIGHNGEAIIWPEYTDARAKRGYALPEIQDCLMLRNKMLAPIFMFPTIAPDYDAKPVFLYTREQAIKRMNTLMSGRLCLVIGRLLSGVGHAVIWDGNKWIDPRGGTFITDGDIPDYTPQEVYIVTRMI